MDLIKYFTNLYKENRQIALLTWIYGSVAVVSLLVAGLFALINQTIGQALLLVPGICVLVLIMNLIVWSLVRSTIESIEDSKKRKKSSK